MSQPLAGARGARGATLTWLVKEAPELILYVRLALLQVLLLETGGWVQPGVSPAPPRKPRPRRPAPRTASLPHAVRGGKAGKISVLGSRRPRGLHSHIDELGLPPHQQMLLVDELEPVHQHVILAALWKPEAH